MSTPPPNSAYTLVPSVYELLYHDARGGALTNLMGKDGSHPWSHDCTNKMAAKNNVLCTVLIAILATGLYDVLVNHEPNGCAMTYMFQYPTYLVSIFSLSNSFSSEIVPLSKEAP